jgi:siroheme synthase-like protein
MPDLLPLFVKLTGRTVVLVGGGGVAAGKLQQLLAAGADIRVVAPEIGQVIEQHVGPRVDLLRRDFAPTDLDGAWLVVAAATPEVNRAVAAAAVDRHIFVNAVDDPPNASAYLSGVVRRDGVTIAISTDGAAPALTALLREGVDALLPRDLSAWMDTAREQRTIWRREAVPMDARKPRLLRALNVLYRKSHVVSPFRRTVSGPAKAAHGPSPAKAGRHEGPAEAGRHVRRGLENPSR